jgi:peptidoglycan hydrolase-like protein with peptidoglycan-binding domain
MARLLHEGITGQDVRELQDQLNRAVPPVPPLKVDGIFGPRTKASVLAFQKAHSLKTDGLVGPETSSVLAANHVIRNADIKKIEAYEEWSATRRPPYVGRPV